MQVGVIRQLTTTSDWPLKKVFDDLARKDFETFKVVVVAAVQHQYSDIKGLREAVLKAMDDAANLLGVEPGY